MQRYLIVIDMQNDFIHGSLGTKEAGAIVSKVAAKIESFAGTVIFTKDTHDKEYLTTQEGEKLPVKHCLTGTDGWELDEEIKRLQCQKNTRVFEKNTFGSIALAEYLTAENEKEQIKEIELVGVCTDICVISNALILKAFLPETIISVDSSCCAGVTKESHEQALKAMEMCQVHIF